MPRGDRYHGGEAGTPKRAYSAGRLHTSRPPPSIDAKPGHFPPRWLPPRRRPPPEADSHRRQRRRRRHAGRMAAPPAAPHPPRIAAAPRARNRPHFSATNASGREAWTQTRPIRPVSLHASRPPPSRRQGGTVSAPGGCHPAGGHHRSRRHLAPTPAPAGCRPRPWTCCVTASVTATPRASPSQSPSVAALSSSGLILAARRPPP